MWDNAKAAWRAGKSPTSVLRSPPTSTRVSARARGHRLSATATSGTERRLPGTSLTLQRHPVGASRWTNAGRARTDAHGVARATVNPQRTSYYRWAYRGDARHAAARSNAVHRVVR